MTRALALLLLVFPGAAAAHSRLVSPPPRFPEGPPSSPTGDQKTRPCGSGPATGKVTEYIAGQSIDVSWVETIEHPGHFRLAFDTTGKDAFPDPHSFTDVTSDANALLDDITAVPGQTHYSASVFLPKTPCDPCSLQLIQVMTDKPPYGDGNDIYYHCADIRLVPPMEDGGSGGGGPQGGSGGSGGQGGIAAPEPPPTDRSGGCSAASAALIVVPGLLRRRRAAP